MKFCGNCGTELNQGVKFCPKCGTKQEESETNHSSQPVEQVRTQVQTNSKSKVVIVSIIAVVLLIGGFVFLKKDVLFNMSASNSSKAKATKIDQVKQNVMPFKNGDYVGLMNDKFEIVQETVGRNVTKFNKHGVAIAYNYGEEGTSVFLIDEKGDIISDEYSSIGTFSVNGGTNSIESLQSENGVFDFTNDDSDTGLINSKGEVVREASPIHIYPFSGKKVTSFYNTSREKMGVLSENGETIIEPIYDQIVIVNENTFVVKTSHESRQFQVINAKGEEIQEDISGTGFYNLASGDFAIQNLNGKYSVLDAKLNVVIDNVFQAIPIASEDGKYFVVFNDDNGEEMLYNRSGEEIVSNGYTNLSLPDKDGYLTYMINNEFGVMDLEGNYLFQDNAPSSSTYNYFNRLGETEVYLLQTEDETFLYNQEGEELLRRESYGGSQDYPRDYILIATSSDSETTVFTVFDRFGHLLSEHAVFVTATDEYILVQEDDQYIRLFSKKDGSEIKGDWLEFDAAYVEESE
ncbi:zinc ribbon domain-containing protein [Enterococcus saccharolyticus]|uniref:Zinc-ribbon domain-containing protein n=1 Tax=Enterococcus saccharolyticus subsp. saccharolyticus ATCC 43076 TaxID=1139996 RepID=S0NXT7_9ENTE|nr:zinc ribbon domain-containing protein [Enterococcus saccharolyticus]EOT29187.1 hypothetical protein OMQ_01139 [Enterococcus saccharolyticus subsp. saccharolyticus ATCC 43076]EOT80986.1 hypothetical protein I572_01518 [Enterococcus saccharolyticus subsp. saccharolyticus ATCC 43076]